MKENPIVQECLAWKSLLSILLFTHMSSRQNSPLTFLRVQLRCEDVMHMLVNRLVCLSEAYAANLIHGLQPSSGACLSSAESIEAIDDSSS
jgi:hypothetical protein